MNPIIKIVLFSLFLIACWLPYYTIGLGKFREALNSNQFFIGLLIALLSLVTGYIGLWVVYKYVKLDPVYFRVLVIVTAQLSSALVVAVISNFNKYVVIGLLIILIGSIFTAFR